MSECRGTEPVTVRVDAEMLDLLDSDAEQFAVYRVEIVRRALDTYRLLRRAEFECPHCEQPIQIEP
jgi:hypothetical protein